MAVYLIHFEPAYKHARHYLGYTPDERLATRMDEHGAGRGARLTQVAVANGCELVLTRLWPKKGRRWERTLKRRRYAPRICPLCNPALQAMPLPNPYGGSHD